MANLQIKGMDGQLYEEVRKLAASEQRSVSQQVLFVDPGDQQREALHEDRRTETHELERLSRKSVSGILTYCPCQGSHSLQGLET
jgi:hypothetical protein